MVPTLDGFLAFVLAQLPANPPPSTVVTSDTNPYLILSYAVALETVNTLLQTVAPNSYVLAVYNLGMHVMVQTAQDVTGQTTWSSLRQRFNIYGNVFGVVTTSSDEGTSVSVEAPEFVKNLSLSDLNYLKTPWGETYVSIAQRCGLNWGLD